MGLWGADDKEGLSPEEADRARMAANGGAWARTLADIPQIKHFAIIIDSDSAIAGPKYFAYRDEKAWREEIAKRASHSTILQRTFRALVVNPATVEVQTSINIKVD